MQKHQDKSKVVYHLTSENIFNKKAQLQDPAFLRSPKITFLNTHCEKQLNSPEVLNRIVLANVKKKMIKD